MFAVLLPCAPSAAAAAHQRYPIQVTGNFGGPRRDARCGLWYWAGVKQGFAVCDAWAQHHIYEMCYTPLDSWESEPGFQYPPVGSNNGYISQTGRCLFQGGGSFPSGFSLPYGCPRGGHPSPDHHWCVFNKYELSIKATRSFTDGDVTYLAPGPTYGHIVTYSLLDLLLTKDGKPADGVSVPLNSSRGAFIDHISVSGPTRDYQGAGVANARVSTRWQPGSSVITSAAASIATAEAADITWLPARYTSKFLVTCYAVANQKHQTGGPMVTIPGLPGKYHRQFYKQIVRQGSGIISDTKQAKRYIQRKWINPKTGKGYKHVHYSFFDCPYTKRGDCATAGKTIAVDPTIIPMHRKPAVYADVSISGKGDRTSEDGGSWVGGYHIDLFYGRTWDDYQACLRWGRNGLSGNPHAVTFQRYVY